MVFSPAIVYNIQEIWITDHLHVYSGGHLALSVEPCSARVFINVLCFYKRTRTLLGYGLGPTVASRFGTYKGSLSSEITFRRICSDVRGIWSGSLPAKNVHFWQVATLKVFRGTEPEKRARLDAIRIACGKRRLLRLLLVCLRDKYT